MKKKRTLLKFCSMIVAAVLGASSVSSVFAYSSESSAIHIVANTFQNSFYILPGTVPVVGKDGKSREKNVLWENDVVDVSTYGTHTYIGTIADSNQKVVLDLAVQSVNGDLPSVSYWDDTDVISDIKQPNSMETLKSLEIRHSNSRYGARASGYLVPPKTGEYVFYISASEKGSFSLSTSSEKKDLKTACYVSKRTAVGDYERDDIQISKTYNLTAGEKYYFEMEYLSGPNDKHYSVHWLIPGETKHSVISSQYLRAYKYAPAPRNGVVDDENDTFDFTFAKGYTNIEDYEYSTDAGVIWRDCIEKPINVGNEAHTTGSVRVRVKETANHTEGMQLTNFDLYTAKPSYSAEEKKSVIWQLGAEDKSNAELMEIPETDSVDIIIPADMQTETDRSAMLPKGMNRSKFDELNITYQLDEIPKYGVNLNFRVLDAYCSTPQMAVFSNDYFAGMYQVTGINGSGSQYAYRAVYQMYIPKEFLTEGENKLSLILDRGMFMNDPDSDMADEFFWLDWDYLRLDKYEEPPKEPIHNRMTRLGTSISSGNLDGTRTLNNFETVKWLGLGYGAGILRSSQANHAKTYKDYNVDIMYGMFDYNSLRDEEFIDNDSIFYESFRQSADYFSKMELSNEPSVFGTNYVAHMNVLEFLDQVKNSIQPWLKINSPGWAYWPSGGEPSGWASSSYYRRQVENLCDSLGGHSYGCISVNRSVGGIVHETLDAFSDWYHAGGDGFPKEFYCTETGCNSNGIDPVKYGNSNHANNAMFDREFRGMIGFASGIMHHAATFTEGLDEDMTYYSVFDNLDTNNLNDVVIYVDPDEANPLDSRVKVFRRLALAYSTHGTPLTYHYLNSDEVKNKKAYFRAVDTAGLGASAIGATSDQILLNYVNFDLDTVNMNVSTEIPNGTYFVERYINGMTYGDSYSTQIVEVNDGQIRFEENILSGDSVQYILSKYTKQEVPMPIGFEALPSNYNSIDLKWSNPDDFDNLKGYELYDNGEFVANLSKYVTSYTHSNLDIESVHQYTVYAVNYFGEKSAPYELEAVKTLKLPTTVYTTSTDSSGMTIYHFGGTDVEPVGGTVQDWGASRFYGGADKMCNIDNFPFEKGKQYALRINVSADATRATKVLVLYNGEYLTDLPIPQSSNGTVVTFANLPEFEPTENGILSIANYDDGIYKHFLYFELLDRHLDTTVPSEWHHENYNSQFMFYSSDDFVYNPSTLAMQCSKPDEYFAFTFKGTGFEWITNLIGGVNDGVADIYVDGELFAENLAMADTREGVNRTVFADQSLTNTIHSVRIVNKSGTISVTSVGSYSESGLFIVPGCDIIPTEIKLENEHPYTNEEVGIFVTLKNIGVLPTPADTVTGWAISGAGYADYYTNSIMPGEEVTMEMKNSSGTKLYWTTPKEPGVYTLRVHLDDVNRYGTAGQPEVNIENNYLTVEVEVLAREEE